MLRLFLLSFLLISASATAATSSARLQFKTLLDAAQSGELASHQAQLKSVQGHLLYPYLIAADLTWKLQHAPSTALDQTIRSFIKRHPNLPPADSLRKRWVASLAKRTRWQLVLAYVHQTDGTSLQCARVHALIATGDDKAAADDALKLWHAGYSQPKACNPVFAWLDKTGRLTTAVILERARLAAVNGRKHLVQYLANKMPQPQRDTASYWAALIDSPGDLRFATALQPDVAVAVFKDLALQDPVGAAQLLPKLIDQLDLDTQHVYTMRRYVALLYAQEHRPQALARFKLMHAQRMDDYARAWRIRAALYQYRWSTVLRLIDQLPAGQATDQRWRYWRARALEQTGQTQAAQAGYAKLAGNRSFFGYLAADQLGRNYSFNARPVTRDTSFIKHLQQRPNIRRAHALLAVDMRNWARDEWRLGTHGLSAIQLRQAALLADDWGWHFEAIVTLADSGYWDDLDIRYPLQYGALAKASAQANNLDPALVLSIIRTESLFRAEAVSSANAYGLMQLLPSTARLVARNIGVSPPNIADLKTPAINIALGSAYLRRMLNRFGGNLSLAMAAYNAGPGNVENWLPKHSMPADIWVENIPYSATRAYVRRAMTHMTAFQHRLGEKVVPLAQRMPAVAPASKLPVTP